MDALRAHICTSARLHVCTATGPGNEMRQQFLRAIPAACACLSPWRDAGRASTPGGQAVLQSRRFDDGGVDDRVATTDQIGDEVTTDG